MNPRRKKRLAIISTIVLGLGAVTGLVLYALSQNIDLFYTPSEIHYGKKETGVKPTLGQRLDIGGIVIPGSVIRNADTLEVSFDLGDMKTPTVFTEQDPKVTVQYTGILPDLFREGQGIVAQGMLTDGFIIKATEVLAKHDEEYMPKEIADSAKKKHKNVDYGGN
ncbi:cytochrome c maturation protein CcmE [Psychrosphaera sp. B3R10]|uniref:cytochrome c maturation protein CcmE n=1 Tax=unclassified Psychrosphaera TaxID=2641570 RepID=UPI001C09A3C1|nr:MULTISPECIES: cytochrome c maturation protein CcmE [unclassified Psychrosphaera]MBU2883107.1 cytochrome c maturation protein CcmE [Psychrosphaera sp. I2R16]MBU2988563.1 cytochrome c maturation protein CcmE [Psychrosphaera sp. B3R10]